MRHGLVRKSLIRLLDIQRRSGGVLRHSVDEIARSRIKGRGAGLRKIHISGQAGRCLVLFLRTVDKPGSHFSWGARQGLRRQGQERLATF